MTWSSTQLSLPTVVEPAELVSGVLDGVLHQLVVEPWSGALVVLLVATAVVRGIPGLVHGRRRRDPQRCFLRADKRLVLQRAGQRCEHHSLFGRRCTATDDLQADHVHPHSRGGATSVDNGQALCPRHNTRKAARVPWDWQLRRLAQQRAGYFPPGTSTVVVRH